MSDFLHAAGSATDNSSDTDTHVIAQALFNVRHAIAAARAVLAEDRAIARPLPTQAISETEFWDDSLAVGKKRASELLRDAAKSALDLYHHTGHSRRTRLGSLAVTIKRSIEHTSNCLREVGVNNDARMSASYEIETAWQLSAVALCVFAIDHQGRSVGSNSSGDAKAAVAKRGSAGRP